MVSKLKKLCLESFIRIVFEHFVMILLFLIIIAISSKYYVVFIAYLFLVFYIVKFLLVFTKQIVEIKRINVDDLKSIEEQLKKPIVYSRWNYILLDKYLINIKRFAIIKYEDIGLIYKRYFITTGNRYYIAKYLYVFTIKGKKSKYLINYPLYGPFNVCDFTNVIKSKNPDVLVGKTFKNKALFEEKYNVRLSDIKWMI